MDLTHPFFLPKFVNQNLNKQNLINTIKGGSKNRFQGTFAPKDKSWK